MNCRKVTHLLSAYIDGELPGVEHRQIHEHLAGCQECMQEHRGLVQMKRMLASMRMRDPSPDLPQRILAQVQTHPTVTAPWLDRINRWVQVQGLKPQSLALAASFALGGIIFASYTIDRVDTSDHIASFQRLTPAQVAGLQPVPMTEASFDTPEALPMTPMQDGNYPYLQSDYRSYDYHLVRRHPMNQPPNLLFSPQPVYHRLP